MLRDNLILGGEGFIDPAPMMNGLQQIIVLGLLVEGRRSKACPSTLSVGRCKGLAVCTMTHFNVFYAAADDADQWLY